MYKLVVLLTFVAIAAARPSGLYSSPLIYSAPAAYAYSASVLAPDYTNHLSVKSGFDALPRSIAHSTVVHGSPILPVVHSYASPLIRAW